MNKMYAVIEKDVVINIIMASSLESANELTGETCLEMTDPFQCEIGWIYDAETGSFSNIT